MISLTDKTEGTITEPLTLSEVKSHLRVSISEDNRLIEDMIKPAREKAEQVTAMSLVPHTYELIKSDHDGVIDILRPPVSEITSVERWSGSEYVIMDDEEWTIAGDVILVNTKSRIRLTYETTAFDCSDLHRMMKDLIAVWYDNRPDAENLEANVTKRMSKYKVWQVE